jgi:hypothetical protein
MRPFTATTDDGWLAGRYLGTMHWTAVPASSLLLCALFAVPHGGSSAAQASTPVDAVRAALDSMGGIAVLRSITQVRVEGAGFAMGDEHPPAPTVFSFIETRDDRHPRVVQDVTVIAAPASTTRSVRTLTLDGDSVRIESAGRTQRRGARAMDDWFTEAPENVLVAALGASDLTSDGERAARFGWHGRVVRIAFAERSGWLESVDLNGAVTTYSRWQPAGGGVRYPRQWNMTHNGLSTESYTASAVIVERD